MKPVGFPDLPSDWVEDHDRFASLDDNRSLFLNVWRKKVPTQGRALLIIHGQGEYGGRYAHFPYYLHNSIDFIAAVDLRGHGKSEGTRGHVGNFSEYISDAKAALTRFQVRLSQWTRKSEIHCMGHSMGGLIAYRMLQDDETLPIKSVSLSSPLLKLKMPVPPVKKFMAQLIRPVLGGLTMSNELDPTYISHDPEVQKAYVEDQLNHNKVTPQFFVQMLKAMDTANEYDGEFAYSVQFQVPLADPIVDPEHLQGVFARLKLKSGVDKQMATYAGFLHESFNEIGKEKAFGDLEQWILKHS